MLDLLNLLMPHATALADARALSEAQLEAYNKAHAHWLVNAKPSLEYIIGLQNFKRPMTVPLGWAYWYAIADEGMI